MQLLRLLSYIWRHRLNAGGRLRALGRVLRWQVASRLLAGPIAMPFVDETFLFAERGMTGATGNWYCGLHEHEEMGFVLHYLRAEDVFLDVGANIGSYSIIAAGAVGSRVVSVEPIPATFQRLKRNIELNGLAERVEPKCIGLSNENSELRFTADHDTVNHVLADGEVGVAIKVPVMRMDDIFRGEDIPAVIKIDVEGHELAVLRGAKNTLSDKRVAAVIMEINGSGERYGIKDDELLEIMRGHGFAPFAYDPITRHLREWRAGNANAIFIRDEKAVNARVAQARRYRLVNGTI